MKPIKSNNDAMCSGKKIVAIAFLFFVSSSLLKAGSAPGQAAHNNGKDQKSVMAKAEIMDNAAIIRWSVAKDGRYRFFIIERSKDKVHYEFVSMVKNKGGTASTISYYATDHNPLSGTAYYRISATDLKEQPVRLFEVAFSPLLTQN